jgi:uncharacterized protein (TIGR03437 family)
LVLLAVTATTAWAQCYKFTATGATLEIDITDFTLKNGPAFSSGGAYSTNDRFEGTNTLIVGGSTKTSQSTANTPQCVQCEIGTTTLDYSAGGLTAFTFTVPTNTEPSQEFWGVTLGSVSNVIPSGVLPQPAAFPPISSWTVNAQILVATNTSSVSYPITAIGACSGSSGGSPSETTTVTVNGNQGPWEQSLNPKFDYGDGSNTGPAVVSASSGISFTTGGTITVTYASGQVNVFPEGGYSATDANGYSGNATNKQVIATYGSYPSYFMNASSYPVYASELVGTFANNGVIVGTPFPIGDGPSTFVIPAGANQLLLGVDDNDYSDNTGSWTLSVSYAPLVVNHVLNGASYQPSGIVPGSLATIYGANLSPVTDSWEKYIVDGKYPTTFDGVSVTIGGKPAYLSYISSLQINLIVPEVGSGPQDVVVKNTIGASTPLAATVSTTGPAFLLWPKNQAVATSVNYALLAESGTFPGATTAPAKPGDVVVLWGTGFGPTDPADPIGEETPTKGTYSTTTLPTVTLNDVPVKVYGAALAGGEGGIYQVAIQVPSSMPDGNWDVQASIGGVKSPSGVVLAVQQ